MLDSNTPKFHGTLDLTLKINKAMNFILGFTDEKPIPNLYWNTFEVWGQTLKSPAFL